MSATGPAQIGDRRLGAIDDNHSCTSMSHKDGKTAQIYRSDGTRIQRYERPSHGLGLLRLERKVRDRRANCCMLGKSPVRLALVKTKVPRFPACALVGRNGTLRESVRRRGRERNPLSWGRWGVLPNRTPKAPTGWSVEKKSKGRLFSAVRRIDDISKRNKGLEIRPVPREIGHYHDEGTSRVDPVRRRVHVRRQGQNCALKYQDEVESNISFVDFAAKRKHNNRRPVLGQAAPWKRLDCAAHTKIDDMDFSEFVVRLDCPMRLPNSQPPLEGATAVIHGLTVSKVSRSTPQHSTPTTTEPTHRE